MNSSRDNPDSTYYSLYENLEVSQKKKRGPAIKINNSKFLDNIHKEVLLHWQGKVLLGRLQVEQYMKQISKIKLKTHKDQYFAEKIQSSLLKIFNIAKQFERTFSIEHISEIADPMENCSFTQDLNLVKKDNNKDLKQILLRTTSVNTEKSFPINMLTNDNFVTLVSEHADSSKVNLNVHEKQKQFSTETGDNKMEINSFNTVASIEDAHSLDLFLSQNNEVYIGNYSDCSKQSVSGNISCDISDIALCTQHEFNIAESKLTKRNLDEIREVESNSQLSNTSTESNTSKEFEDVTTKILRMKNAEDSYYRKYNLTPSDISETIIYYNEDQNFNNLNVNSVNKTNLKSVLGLDSLFNESCTKKINNLCYGMENNSEKNKSWQEIQNDLGCEQNLLKNVSNTLSQLFERLSLDEHENEDKQCGEKLCKEGSFHNFCAEDERKLDLESLVMRNNAKLEKISQEFKENLNLEKMKTLQYDDEDSKRLDWKKIVEIDLPVAV